MHFFRVQKAGIAYIGSKEIRNKRNVSVHLYTRSAFQEPLRSVPHQPKLYYILKRMKTSSAGEQNSNNMKKSSLAGSSTHVEPSKGFSTITHSVKALVSET